MKFGLLVLGVILASCDGSTSSITDLPEPRYSWLQVEADVEPKVIEYGEKLQIRLSVTNTSEEVQALTFANGCTYGFTLRDKNGHIFWPPPPICTMNAPVMRFEPQQTKTFDLSWIWNDATIETGVYYLVAGTGPRGEYDMAAPIEVRFGK
jgi:hypothetical protein|nr:BsuPI-related putative proteinase inhibitor [Candidatus Krumholzibacteria bacterium]